MPYAQTELCHILRGEIAATGPISCARFMELALYHPVYGYYRQLRKQVGRQGDFYTSVSAGSLFGWLLAFQCDQWLKPLLLATSRAPAQLVEAGAHDGQLAVDILSWFQQQRPGVFHNLQYCILEPSSGQRDIQRRTLNGFGERVFWFSCWEELGTLGIRGVILANELLDSFPVYRLGWDPQGRNWFEWRVDWQDNAFTWTRTAARSPEVESELGTEFWRNLPDPLLGLLPDGFTVEVSPAARAWWRQAAMSLREGRLVTLDYGFEADEFLAPQRANGTLRGYRHHHLAPDPLANPGVQDLTAHVNFTALRETGEDVGLATECFCPQAAFLTRIVEEVFKNPARFGPWTGKEDRQLQTLTHPEHLGRSFRVLVQSVRPRC